MEKISIDNSIKEKKGKGINIITSQNTVQNILDIQMMSSDDTPHGCGYCQKNGEKTMKYYSIGFSTSDFSPEMYEKIMFLGWRRCGDYIYRPILEKNCCKMYSIRLDINKFKINKNQRRNLRNFSNFLVGKFKKEKTEEKLNSSNTSDMSLEIFDSTKQNKQKKDKNFMQKFIIEFLSCGNVIEFFCNINKVDIQDYKKIIAEEHFIKLYPCKYKNLGQFTTSIFIVLFNKFRKNLNQQVDVEFYKNIFNKLLEYKISVLGTGNTDLNINLSEKTGHFNFNFSNQEILKKYGLDDLTDISSADDKKNRVINSVNPRNAFNNIKDSKSIDTKSIKDFYCILEKALENPFNVPEILVFKNEIINTYSLELELNSNLTDEKFEVYKKYQIAVHHDKPNELTKARYREAWGKTNLNSNSLFDKNILRSYLEDQYKTITNTEEKKDLISKIVDLIPDKFGTYDLIHRINGKIVAVGVLDILPESMSSVYLYYDPDFSSLNLGVFTALKEIEYVMFLQRYISEHIHYYVMGFYIYDCQKMRYKGEYYPSEILCPISLKFYPLDDPEVIKVLKEKNNQPLSKTDGKHPNLFLDVAAIQTIFNQISLEFNQQSISLSVFLDIYLNNKYKKIFQSLLVNFIRHYGPENAKNSKFVLN